MEPRARAGKNVGKMNFGFGELRQLLYGSGDAREPLPETMRLLDEIATDFIQSLSFEAARIGHYSGRQKIKYEDFEFALRRNPLFLGKVREMFEMSKEVKDARKMPGIGEGNLAKADINDLAKLGEGEADDGKDDKNGKDGKVDKNDGAAGNTKKRANGKGDGAGSKKKKAKTAATNKAADEAKEARADASSSARKAAASAWAEPADVAAKEEPDLEEPSGLDALFGDDDDDALGFDDEPGTGDKSGLQNSGSGSLVKNEDDLGDLAAEMA